MRGTKKTVLLNEIENQAAMKGIQGFDTMIASFVSELNRFLPSDFQLDIENRIFDIQVTHDEKGEYLNDGNTNCPGNKYEIVWAYKLFPVQEFNPWYVRNGLTTGFLKFTLSFSERIKDGRVRSKWVHSYVCGLPRDRKEDRPSKQVFYINNNYSNHVADRRSMVETIILLKQMVEDYKIYMDINDVDFTKFQTDEKYFEY